MEKTLIVATTSFAGMGPYVSEIVNGFSVHDEVFFFFCDYEDDYFFKNVKTELHEKSYFFKLPNTKLNKIRDLLPIKSSYHDKVIAFCKEKGVRVVHFINKPAPLTITKDLKKLSISVVSTVHDLHPHESNKLWYKEFRFRIIYAKLKRNILYSDNFIANSRSQFNELKETFYEKKIFFHSFPSLVTKEIANGKIFPKELVGRSRPYILFFGRIEEYKGISLLYKAFVECQEINERYDLVIAGGGDLPFAIDEKKERIVFINRYIKDSEVAELYKNASAVVYPYISATQSGVLSIAFYFRVPTLMSDVPFFKESVLNSEVGMLFEKGNVESLKEKLVQLLNDDAVKIGDAERRFYDLNYDGNAIRKSLLNIYASFSKKN